MKPYLLSVLQLRMFMIRIIQRSVTKFHRSWPFSGVTYHTTNSMLLILTVSSSLKCVTSAIVVFNGLYVLWCLFCINSTTRFMAPVVSFMVSILFQLQYTGVFSLSLSADWSKSCELCIFVIILIFRKASISRNLKYDCR